MDEKTFLQKLKDIGGTAYVVGGYVRDMVMGRKPDDKDYVVCGVREDQFMAKFPDANKVGNSFPVFLLNIAGESCDIAFARTESKFGSGYKGFAVSFGVDVTIEEDLYRRDTTINSMAWSPLTDKVIDPYGGRHDIRNKTIRATSDHFFEDPVRALRAARQAAQFNFIIEPVTMEMMSRCKTELAHEPKERLIGETKKALSSPKPSIFFYSLNSAGLLENIFPWIYKLIGKRPYSKFYPNCDAFDSTMMILDMVAEVNDRVEVRFAALMHDIGKGISITETLPFGCSNEKEGLEVLSRMNSEITLPRLWYSCAAFAIRYHMVPAKTEQYGKIVALLVSLEKHPIGADGFAAIFEACNNGEQADCIVNYKKYISAIQMAHDMNIPADFKGKQIGEWLRKQEIKAYINATKQQG